jgi:hypothetical protein
VRTWEHSWPVGPAESLFGFFRDVVGSLVDALLGRVLRVLVGVLRGVTGFVGVTLEIGFFLFGATGKGSEDDRYGEED